MTPLEVAQIWEEQNKKCAICEEDLSWDKIHVDHNHSTNKIRGLLCENCNRMLGMAHDDIGILIGAVNYLEEWE